MKKIISAILCPALLYFARLSGDSDFGYVSCTTNNIGDDIQALAAKRFLPKNSIPIDREFVGQFNHSQKIKTIVNGWYMYTKDLYWSRNDVTAPEKSWPPSSSIDPLLISIHFTKAFLPTALSDEAVKYMKQYGPVGARDYSTLKELQQRGIPSYFSGCLTLTLENSYKERDDIIYVVDLDPVCVSFIKSKTKYKVEVLHHEPRLFILLNNEQRLKHAERFLNKYRKAKCVITSRLHASMPCLAFETPVLLVENGKDPRFDGLRELTRNCTREELLNGKFDFNFDNPTENPKNYIPIREQLIKRVTHWVRKNSNKKL